MSPLTWVQHHLGLTVMTAVAVALSLYLIYAMIHPERF